MKLSSKQKNTVLRLALSAILAAVALILSETLLDFGVLVKISLFLPAFLAAGFPTLKRAFSGIIRGQIFDENFLMSLASVCALCLGECFEAVAIVLFSGVGEIFENSAVDHVRESVASLASLCPDEATVIKDGQEITVASKDINEGDICLVRAGERIVADGIVIEGSAGIDSSALTGESVPVDVFEGSQVSSGCIDLDGTLKIRVLRRAENSGAARIISMIEDSASRKTSTEKFITRFSLRYTPCVVAAAVIIAVALPLLSLTDVKSALYSALCFLVVSCPCALVISVPLTFFGAIGGGSKKGVLFKSNKALEMMSRSKTVIFDKTGTLTQGRFGVSTVIPFEKTEEKNLLEYAYAAEQSSAHPISGAIVEYAEKNGITVLSENISDVREIRGMGRECVYKGRYLLAGNEKLLSKHKISVPESFRAFVGKGESLVYVASDGELLGLITLCDKPKAGSAESVKALEKQNVKVVMLTGDGKESAENIAQKLKIDEYKYGLLPENKVTLTEQYMKLCTKKQSLVFVGDGINDAPSLARADVGIAMGELGSDVAIEAADVIIVNDDPMKVRQALDISKKAMRIAKENIAFSLAVKFGVLILITVGKLGMISAVFADVGVSVIAILNAMRTLRK